MEKIKIAPKNRNLGLQTKLVLAFLLVSLVSVGIIAFVSDRTVRESLESNAGNNLKNLADSQALIMGNLLGRQVEKLQALGLNKLIQDEVEAASFRNVDNPLTIQSRLEQIDSEWVAASDTDPLIQERLVNGVASELHEFQNLFPDHVEVFITDTQGALLASTNRTSDFYQADEEWWQAAYNEGEGAIFIDIPEFDESSATFSTNMAVPLYAHNTRNVIGVLRTTFDTSRLQTMLGQGRFGQTGQAALYLPSGLELEDNEDELVEGEIDLALLARLEDSGVAYIEADYGGTESLISAAPVVVPVGTATFLDFGWTVVVHQQQQEALAPVTAQTRSTLLLVGLIALSVIAFAVIASRSLAGPIRSLTNVAREVARGNLTIRAPVQTNDEVGTLAEAFNSMTDQLRGTINTLEDRVAARTQQLEAVVEISQQLVSILDLSDLLRNVVTLTKETFEYYHVHIYLLDEVGANLILAEGYGEAGAAMRREEHTISRHAQQSLVAQAAREGQVIIVGNVREDPTWLPNPHLPDTFSEMVVPVKLGEQIVGVLDVQSDAINGLTEEDEATLQVLANQIAVAVRNANLFTDTQDKLYEAERLQRLYTNQAWDQLISGRATTDYEVRQPATVPLAELSTPEAEAALQTKGTVNMRLHETHSAENGSSSPSVVPTMATPLKLRNQIIGVLGIHADDPNRHWTEDEIALIEAVSEQMSLAIENARLFEDTQRTAWRDRVVGESTGKLWASAKIDEVLKAAVSELGDKLKASEVVIRLGVEDEA